MVLELARPILNKLAENRIFFTSKRLIVMELNEQLGMNKSYTAWRKHWQRNAELNKLIEAVLHNETDRVELVGFTAKDTITTVNLFDDMAQYFAEAEAEQKKKDSQVFRTNSRWVCFANISDTHFGGAVDIKRLWDETKIVNETPNMFLNFVGDPNDNFIPSWAHHIALTSKFNIEQQIQIFEQWMKLAGKKMVAFTLGNHGRWSNQASGMDIFARLVAQYAPQTFYGTEEVKYTAEVGGMKFKLKLRHHWRGNNNSNPFGGIQKAALHEWFDIGVGAHIHTSGLCSEFNVNGRTGVALMCGCFKRYDDYQIEQGFPNANKSTTTCVIVDTLAEVSPYILVSDVHQAAKVMRTLNK